MHFTQCARPLRLEVSCYGVQRAFEASSRFTDVTYIRFVPMHVLCPSFDLRVHLWWIKAKAQRDTNFCRNGK